MRVEPLKRSFGAKVYDLSLPDLNTEQAQDVYDLWLKYALLIFPGQHLSNDQQIKFAKNFTHIDLNYRPIKKINNIDNKLSYWDLNLNLVLNPTSSRAVLIGDAAHSIHPLAGQGLNLSLRDCVSALKAIENCLNFGNDLGDKSILKLYKSERLPKTISMTVFTDLMFYGFTETSNKTQTLLTNGMKNLNKTNLKNIFRDLASI